MDNQQQQQQSFIQPSSGSSYIGSWGLVQNKTYRHLFCMIFELYGQQIKENGIISLLGKIESYYQIYRPTSIDVDVAHAWAAVREYVWYIIFRLRLQIIRKNNGVLHGEWDKYLNHLDFLSALPTDIDVYLTKIVDSNIYDLLGTHWASKRIYITSSDEIKDQVSKSILDGLDISTNFGTICPSFFNSSSPASTSGSAIQNPSLVISQSQIIPTSSIQTPVISQPQTISTSSIQTPVISQSQTIPTSSIQTPVISQPQTIPISTISPLNTNPSLNLTVSQSILSSQSSEATVVTTKTTTKRTSSVVPKDTKESSGIKFSDLFNKKKRKASQCNWNRPGKQLDYVADCQNGRCLNRFGKCSDLLDIKAQIRLFDTKQALKDPELFWRGKTRETDITLTKDDEITLQIEKVFDAITHRLHEQGATFTDPSIPVNKNSVKGDEFTDGEEEDGEEDSVKIPSAKRKKQ